MGFPSFLLSFFLVSHLLVLHSSVFSCPSSFDCGTHAPFKFPFTNRAYYECGLCTLSCDEGALKVKLGDEGKSIQVSNLADDAIKISDPFLEKLIKSKNCDFFSYVHPINTGSISYTISPNQTFFKCLNSSPDHEDQIDKYFPGRYTPYKDCEGYTVYYSYPNDAVPTPGPVPENCTLFQLPVMSPVKDPNPSDPFSLLTSDFSVEYQLSKECRECHNDGGQCPRDIQEFHCLNKTGTGFMINT